MAQRRGNALGASAPALRRPPTKVASLTGRVLGKVPLAELTGLSSEALIGMMRRMMLIREFDSRCLPLYRAGKFRGVTHPYIGQEAVAVGTMWNLRDEDYITSTHRGHGHVLAKGADPNRCMAELMGKATGYCKGRGGSLHLADIGKGILGANGIVGGGLGMGAGSALASRMLGRDRVSVSFFGEGTLNQGILHEVSNMAAIWKLPIVFLCENNIYAMSAAVDDFVARGKRGFLSRSDAYGIPGIECDGMNVIDVFVAVKEAVDRARSGDGPTYVFCHTYRVTGHHVGDPLNYRDKGEPALWMKRDPIRVYGDLLLKDKLATAADIDNWASEAKTAIDVAVDFAERSPAPDAASVMDGLFG